MASHVAQKLLERGDSVVIVDNMNDGYDRYIKEYNLSLVLKADTENNLSIYTVDICDSDAIEYNICTGKTRCNLSSCSTCWSASKVLMIPMNILEQIMKVHW